MGQVPGKARSPAQIEIQDGEGHIAHEVGCCCEGRDHEGTLLEDPHLLAVDQLLAEVAVEEEVGEENEEVYTEGGHKEGGHIDAV